MTDPTQTPLPRQRSAVERILGDRPGALVLKLALTSLLVGFLMSVFGFDARDVLDGVVVFFRETFRDGSGVFRSMVGYVVTGAALVVPIWLVLRLTKGRG